MKVVVDLVLIGLTAGMTYALMSEGLWGAALMFFNILFSAIVALNFYEPLAQLIATSAEPVSGMADSFSLIAIFCVTLIVLRLTSESLAPTMIRFPPQLTFPGALAFALAGSVATMGILILGLHCAPVEKHILGSISYKSKPPFGLGFDHRTLGFFQFTTGQVFSRPAPGRVDRMHQYDNTMLFDPRATWLLDHQDARPHGSHTVIDDLGQADGGSAAAATPTDASAPAAGGGAAGAGGPPQPPGGPPGGRGGRGGMIPPPGVPGGPGTPGSQ